MSFRTSPLHITRGINETVKRDTAFSIFIFQSFGRYLREDWGDICKEDWDMNDSAVKYENDRIVAKYKHQLGDVLIITEWDRSATTILFAEEY